MTAALSRCGLSAADYCIITHGDYTMVAEAETEVNVDATSTTACTHPHASLCKCSTGAAESSWSKVSVFKWTSGWDR